MSGSVERRIIDGSFFKRVEIDPTGHLRRYPHARLRGPKAKAHRPWRPRADPICLADLQSLVITGAEGRAPTYANTPQNVVLVNQDYASHNGR